VALRIVAAAAFLTCVLQNGVAGAQSVTIEAGASSGRSTDEGVSVAGTGLRVFGEAPAGIRFFTEAAVGKTSDLDADAFGAAYPYTGTGQVIESYAGRMFKPGRVLVDVRAGRYRTPFGISSGSDQGYVGFSRAPLIRYDNYYALSNNFLEQGVDVMVGAPWLTMEASVGAPGDVGSARRRRDVDTVIRLQAFHGPFIVGVSRIWTRPYQDPLFAQGRSLFTGVDGRWMRDGIQVRGEWLTGQPFDGTTTSGWYVDTIVHRMGMGPVTLVGRVERSDYDTPYVIFAMHATRQTVGAKIRIVNGLVAQVNVLHQTGVSNYASTALDVGVMYSVRQTLARHRH
jgi:hypothetical protein